MKKIKIAQQDIDRVLEEIRKMLSEAKVPIERINKELNPVVKLEGEDKVKITFETEAYKKMLALIDLSQKEIGWHGVVERDEENPKQFYVTDILVFPQEVTGVNVCPDAVEYSNWVQMLMMGAEPVLNKVRFHGHSHVNMATSPSGVDTQYQKDLMEGVNDFYIFGIFNKRGDWWMTVFDIENNVLYERADIEYMYIPEDESSWAKEQIEKYVHEIKPMTVNKSPLDTYGVRQYPGYYGAGHTSVEDDYEDWYGGYGGRFQQSYKKTEERTTATKETKKPDDVSEQTVDTWRKVLDRAASGYY